MKPLRIEPLGDCALLVVLGDRIDAELNDQVHAGAEVLRQAGINAVHDIAPAFASICVQYDPAGWADVNDDRSPFVRLAERIGAILENVQPDHDTATDDPLEIPVCYAPQFAPDLEVVAARAGLSADEIVARHTAAEYRVAMLGFAPGFAYLLGLDAALHTPRRREPRLHVPAGAVAIGGEQTGIYPRESPGGWQIIGRTPLLMFDPAREPPALLAAGQRVRFRNIDADTFAGWSA